MIEFNCQHCETFMSVALDQIGDEIFCPACENEVQIPELDPSMKVKVDLAKAQAKVKPRKKIDTQEIKKMLDEPDSAETKVWKERLAQSFQAVTFNNSDPVKEIKTLKPKEGKEQESKKTGIKKIFDIFPKN